MKKHFPVSPEEIVETYELLERLYPDVPKAEMAAFREQEARKEELEKKGKPRPFRYEESPQWFQDAHE